MKIPSVRIMPTGRHLLLLILLIWIFLLLSYIFHNLDHKFTKLTQIWPPLTKSGTLNEFRPNRNSTKFSSGPHLEIVNNTELRPSQNQTPRLASTVQALMSGRGSSSKTESTEESQRKGTQTYESEDQILQKLWGRTLKNEAFDRDRKIYLRENQFNVVYRGPIGVHRPGPQLYCEFKRRARIWTLDGTEEPFSSMGWDQLVPSQRLEELRTTPYKTCAVVMSAGAMLGSRRGAEIDSHDAVMRFNHAPTKGFENDVGSMTTFRLINSQIVGLHQYNFGKNTMYQKGTLLLWDPAKYSTNLTQWYHKPNFKLFEPYAEHRHLHPEQPFYIIHPQFLWTLWDLIQEHSEDMLQPHPPTSGFIGIVSMMSLCSKVTVYEFLPSNRRSTLCHYYEDHHSNSCTDGSWHPLLYEKVLLQRLNQGGLDEVQSKGRATVKGLGTVSCEETAGPH